MHTRLASINEGPFMTHTVDEMLLKGYSLNDTIGVLLNTTIPGNGSTILDLIPPEFIAMIPQVDIVFTLIKYCLTQHGVAI